MTYAENILIVLIAPLVIGFFLLKGETKRFIGFFLAGTVICLLSSYINSFLAGISAMPQEEVMIKLTPMVEEVMKALPLLFYVIVFAPDNEHIFKAAIAVALGFATFENCCFVVGAGAENLSFVLTRGFAAGIVHTICGAAFGCGLSLMNTRKHLPGYGIFASLCLCITYHAIYNLVVSANGTWQRIGYFMPFITAVLVIVLKYIVSLIIKRKT
jgi:RsiW-degrading membrane proteinase PrsW (M82 family)